MDLEKVKDNIQQAMSTLEQIAAGDVPTEGYTLDELIEMEDPEDADWLVANIAYKWLERALEECG